MAVNWISPIGQFGPMPLIATTPGSLSPQAVNTIYNQHIGQVLVIGGPLAVSDVVMTQLAALGVYSIRLAGIDNTETSTQTASFELSAKLGFGYLNWDFDWTRREPHRGAHQLRRQRQRRRVHQAQAGGREPHLCQRSDGADDPW